MATTVTLNPHSIHHLLPFLSANLAHVVAIHASTSIITPSPNPEYNPILSSGTLKEVIISVMNGNTTAYVMASAQQKKRIGKKARQGIGTSRMVSESCVGEMDRGRGIGGAGDGDRGYEWAKGASIGDQRSFYRSSRDR